MIVTTAAAAILAWFGLRLVFAVGVLFGVTIASLAYLIPSRK